MLITHAELVPNKEGLSRQLRELKAGACYFIQNYTRTDDHDRVSTDTAACQTLYAASQNALDARRSAGARAAANEGGGWLRLPILAIGSIGSVAAAVLLFLASKS